MPALQRPAPPAALVEALKAANVPVESFADACAACEDACDDHDEDLQYPSGFEVDLDSQMLGELKPYGRQILVSTGKSDWIREVTDDEKSIPGLVKAEYEKVEKANGGAGKDGLFAKLGNKVFGSGASEQKGKEVEVPGVHPTAANPPPGRTVSSRLSILSASFISSSHHGHRESVISLPDFKVINEVEATSVSVEELVTRYLEPSVGRAGSNSVKGELQSWPLPYNCVILLCSHRKRDKRCSIAAPLLISQFHHHLEKHGLHVDERGDDLAHGPPIEEWEGTEEEKEVRLQETLQGVKTDGGSVGLFKISHIGGHRYAGNVILYFPNGTSVWFGRVTPADVGVIVDRTIMQGKIIPELLRGGLGLSGKNGPKGVLDW